MKSNQEMAHKFEKKIRIDYDKFIMGRMMRSKKAVIKKLKKRSDISSISMTMPIKKHAMPGHSNCVSA